MATELKIVLIDDITISITVLNSHMCIQNPGTKRPLGKSIRDKLRCGKSNYYLKWHFPFEPFKCWYI